MNYLKSKHKYSILLFSITVLMMSSCFKKHKKVTNSPTLQDYTIGEKWSWEYKGISGEGEVRSEGVDVKEIIYLNGKLGMKQENDTTLLSDILKPNKSETPRYQWPLEVGKKWKFETEFTSAVGVKVIWSQDAEVVSYKEETVKAGTFMAYTIQYKGGMTTSKGFSKTADVIVYAPEVKNFIKMTQEQEGFSYNEELIEYINPNKKK